MHSDNFEGTSLQATVLHQAMTVLLADFQDDWPPEQTLVVLGAEFGCTPRMNDNDGRDDTMRRSGA